MGLAKEANSERVVQNYPKVSVCIASFNGADYIRTQLESILTSAIVDEVIVSDDGSTDDTREIVRSISDSRIVLKEGPRMGLIKNFEYALGLASGDIIFLSDQDDIWLPNKVDRVCKLLATVDLVVTDCFVVDQNLNVLSPSFFLLNGSKSGLLNNLVHCGYLGCCLAFNRRVLDIAFPFPPDIAMHDWWIGLVAQKFGQVIFFNEPLSLYRRHATNVSTASLPSTKSLITRVFWRINMIRYLFVRYFKVLASHDT